MWLSGFHHPQIKISLEVGIADIDIEDAETKIKGRMDILAATRSREEATVTALWFMLIESKNIAFLMSIRLCPHPKPLSQNGRGALREYLINLGNAVAALMLQKG